MLRRLVRLTIAALLLAVLAAGGGFFWLRSSLPETSGETRVQGVSASVTIVRDGRGVPAIQAKTVEDGWFAVGYVHAQDRLWQMEATRRFALGRLAEIVGPAVLEVDKSQRRLGLGELARRQYATVDNETRAALDAYAAGVNAAMDAHEDAWPPEFVVLRAEPMRWEPWHGLLWGRQMALQLSARWREDLRRERLLHKFGPERFRDLYPDVPLPKPLAFLLDDDKLGPAATPPPRGASNAWAVAPSRSKSGGALLAGDPHLGFQLPNTWYLLRVTAAGRTLEGATAPGAPFVILGRNDRLAWSFTSSEADLQDVVRVGAADVTDARKDEIAIKDADPVVIQRKETAVGPVIGGDILEPAAPAAAKGLALQATALSPGDSTPVAFRRLNMAHSLADAMHALADFGAPFMNVVIADADGRIALATAGNLPVRNGHSGRLPLSAVSEAWTATLNGSTLPATIDPPIGALANANERTTNLPSGLPGDWAAPVRRQRLDALLSGGPFDAAAMAAMQADVVDAGWPAWRARLSVMMLADPFAEAWRQRMLAWDGAMTLNAGEPLLFAAWIAALETRMMRDERQNGVGVGLRAPDANRFLDWIDAGSTWCLDAKSGQGSCDGMAQLAFSDALTALRDRLGDDRAKWRWGEAHMAFFRHPLLGRIPWIGGWFDRAVETPGGDRTLNRGATASGSGAETAFPNVHGAGFRAVHDLAPGRPSLYALPLGQSGNPFSPHYDDLTADWRDGRTFKIGDGPETGRLVLRPK